MAGNDNEGRGNANLMREIPHKFDASGQKTRGNEVGEAALMGESGRYRGVTGDPRLPFHATVLLLKLPWR